jgi:hypothetical protein
MMPGGVNYIAHQHAQQQQALMASRNPLHYSHSSMHQQQQTLAAYHAFNAGGANGLSGMHSGPSVGVTNITTPTTTTNNSTNNSSSNNDNVSLSTRAFPDYNNLTTNSRENFQIGSRGMGNNQADGSSSEIMHFAPGGGNGGSNPNENTSTKEPDASYLTPSGVGN